MLKKLNRKNADITTSRPVKVLQFGEGNFLRAFVDWIIETLNEKTDFNGDVQVVQPINKGMGQMINDQDGLYHVVLNGIKNGKASTETKLITCVQGVINPYDDYQKYLATGENPALQFIISNTTEAGIAFDEKDSTPTSLPDSFPGKVTALLHHRFNHFKGASDKGLIVIPCELIDKNGEKLQQTILQYIDHWKLSSDFKNWIVKSNTFCNTLVDRIVPGFPKETIDEIKNEIGFDDNLVVMAEPFHLWVIEAPDAVKGKFPTEKAGLDVKFVKDQTPYRTRKVRILNGAHTSLVPVAYLYGIRMVRESIDDPKMGAFIKETINDEIIPTLDLPLDELNQFAHDVIERFQNPFVKHELASIALNSISKFKVRVLPSLLEYHKRKNTLPTRLVYSLACLIQFYKGTWENETLPVNDNADIMEFFKEAWQSDDETAIATKVLSNVSFWDQDLTKVPGLTESISKHLKQLKAEGVRLF